MKRNKPDYSSCSIIFNPKKDFFNPFSVKNHFRFSVTCIEKDFSKTVVRVKEWRNNGKKLEILGVTDNGLTISVIGQMHQHAKQRETIIEMEYVCAIVSAGSKPQRSLSFPPQSESSSLLKKIKRRLKRPVSFEKIASNLKKAWPSKKDEQQAGAPIGT